MEGCGKSTLLLLWWTYIMIPVVEAQEVQVPSEVTGCPGHDVILPCHFIPGEQNYTFTQGQWYLERPEGEKLVIAVFNPNLGVNVKDTFLKERVEIAEQSLIIRRVKLTDAGSYTCTITTYPSGVWEKTTNLIVQGKMLSLWPKIIAGGVFVLIVVIMFAATHFIIVQKRTRRVTEEEGVNLDLV